MRFKLKDGTGEMTLKYLIEDIDRYGQSRVYLRRVGFKKVRLFEQPGTDAFLAEYKLALSGLRPNLPADRVEPGSFHWLSVTYQKSAEYLSLNWSTKDMRKLHLERLCEKYGDLPVLHIQPRHVRSMLDPYIGTPFTWLNTLKTIRVLFKWAVSRDYLTFNPARDVERIRPKSTGFHTWTAAEIRKYLERHPLTTKAGFALALLYHTGARRSDVVKLGRQMENDGWLSFWETKGGESKLTEVFITEDFRAILDMHHAGDRLHYLVTESGNPFTANGFGNWFRDRCREAGLDGCTAHGLRKSTASRAAERGATAHEIMALLGHSSPSEGARYTKGAERRRMAENVSKLVKLPGQKGN